jgi:hypothetical protein
MSFRTGKPGRSNHRKGSQSEKVAANAFKKDPSIF